MGSAIGPCPWCGGEAAVVNGPPGRFFVSCLRDIAFDPELVVSECWSGPILDTPDESIAAWNRVAEAVGKHKEAK